MEDEKKLVLITDDNEISAMIVQNILNSYGLEADIAENGRAAGEAVRKKNYSLILMDYMMPEMDGVEAVKLLRMFTKTPVIALSANTDAELKTAFIAAGAQGIIGKPVDPEELEQVLEEYLPDIELIVSEKTEETDKDSDFRRVLKSIHCIDYDEGLKNSLGNEQNYYHVVKASVNNIKEYIKMLERYKLTGENEQLKIAAHSLKSVFANLGIIDLSAGSAEIEKKADNIELNESTKKEIEEFLSQISIIDDELAAAVSEYEKLIPEEPVTEPEEPVGALEMAELIVKTMRAIDRFEIDYIIDGLEKLKRASIGSDRKKMEQAIRAAHEFDYDYIRTAVTEFSTPKKDRGEAR